MEDERSQFVEVLMDRVQRMADPAQLRQMTVPLIQKFRKLLRDDALAGPDGLESAFAAGLCCGATLVSAGPREAAKAIPTPAQLNAENN